MSEPASLPKQISARSVAASAIMSVMTEHSQLETGLEHSPGYRELEPRDRAFARLLVSTLFRRSGQIEQVLKPMIKKPPPLFVKTVLRLGVVQILILKTPLHAAVGESVDLVKSRPKYRAFAGLVNAVLRKVGDQGAKSFAMTTPQDNLPGWLRGAWQAAYGRTEMRRMAVQLMETPPLDLSVKADPDLWAERLGGSVIYRNTVRLSSSNRVSGLPGFEDGAWWVQDISAALPVGLAGDLSGKRVLDMCAAPGGKTLQMAAMGAEVSAIDKSEQRMKRVADNLSRTGLKADIIVADVLNWGDPEPLFDLVLLDAPCTATGTFRRHPDVIHAKSPKSLSRLVKLQASLFSRAAQWVKPGGSLIYSTCSLQVEEGEGQIAKFLKRNEKFAVSPIAPLPGLELPEQAYNNGFLRLLPHYLGPLGGMDGFFTAKLDCLG